VARCWHPMACCQAGGTQTLRGGRDGVLCCVVSSQPPTAGDKAVRDDIKATSWTETVQGHTRVTRQAQSRLFVGAGPVVVLAVVPMMVMACR